MRRTIVFLTILALCLVCKAEGGVNYRAMAPYAGGYLICGQGDRLDLVGPDAEPLASFPLGESLDLKDIAVLGATAVAVGEGGSLLVLEDGKPAVMSFPGMDFGCIESFRGHFVIGCSDALLIADEHLDIVSVIAGMSEGRIISVSACGGSRICAVSESGDFLYSTDGLNWSVCRFNEEYNGYYPELRPAAVAAGPAQYALAGMSPDGTPAVYLSPTGAVWSARTLDYSENGERKLLGQSIKGAVFDSFNDRMAFLCEEGTVFFVPGCSHCNSLEKTRAGDLYDARSAPGLFLAVGDDSFAGIIGRR